MVVCRCRWCSGGGGVAVQGALVLMLQWAWVVGFLTAIWVGCWAGQFIRSDWAWALRLGLRMWLYAGNKSLTYCGWATWALSRTAHLVCLVCSG
ncbi:hypothetical protein RchiOBHm_Chr1g0363041 [Rosa chinensis]|uniref:Uncharacterized protein n=1 Tax=Rosa chinensis TaxID=74649 RepID=A0A2P6SJC7_ROSCH|nr:hypothetical protein RchiOBHm_Chr1g0363041 [Rosa chinensis]